MSTIEWVGSPNFSSRDGRSPIAIVDHITAGSFPGCLNWMCNPTSQASAHYLVAKSGRIFQMVKDEDKAWHSGGVNNPSWKLYDGTNPNLYTIGIEHEGQPGDVMPDAQYQSSLWLHQQIMSKYPIITDDTDHIIGHYRIDSVNKANCPGSGFPWDRLFKDLEGGNDVLDVAILKFSAEDEWAAKDIDAKLGGVANFTRQGVGRTIPKDAMSAKKLIVIGGATTGHSNEVLLSGNTKYDTAAVVAKYLG